MCLLYQRNRCFYQFDEYNVNNNNFVTIVETVTLCNAYCEESCVEGKWSSLAIRRAVVETTENLTVKLLKQRYLYHKLRKGLPEFYNRRYELVSYFGVGLKILLHEDLSEPEVYG